MTRWRIYRMKEEAWEAHKTWDEVFANGEDDIETIEEFDTLKEADEAYRAYDPDRYGVDVVRG